MKQGFVNKLVVSAEQHRFVCFATIGLICIVAAYFTSKVVIDDQPRELFQRNGQEIQTLEEMFRDFGPDDNHVLLVIDGDELFTPERISGFRDLSTTLNKLPSVLHVQSIVDVRRKNSRILPLIPTDPATTELLETVKQEALRNPLVAGQFLSRDGTMMLVVVELAEQSEALSQIERAVYEIHAAAKAVLEPIGLRVRMAGHPAIRIDLINKTRVERTRFLIMGGSVSAILALLIFRNLASMIVCVAGPAIGVLWTMGSLGDGGTSQRFGNDCPSLGLHYWFLRFRSPCPWFSKCMQRRPESERCHRFND
ncbi:MAG: MMPL family transporter [Pirellulaceae bacterium]